MLTTVVRVYAEPLREVVDEDEDDEVVELATVVVDC